MSRASCTGLTGVRYGAGDIRLSAVCGRFAPLQFPVCHAQSGTFVVQNRIVNRGSFGFQCAFSLGITRGSVT